MRDIDADLVVIGGGAAGMLASAFAAQRGISTVLLEPNRQLGKKLRITGNGRCNLTNNCDVSTFINNVVRNGRFLYGALSRFSPSDTMALFESLGLRLKTESGNRVFPASDSSGEVVHALSDFMHRSGVKVVRVAARQILAKEGAVSAVITSNDEIIKCRAAILCTGGLSYPGTGSKGDGYAMARELGHNITPLGPSLVPLVSREDYCKEMQGLSLKNVRLTACDGKGKVIFQELGEMVFTHFGISCPLVLSASARMEDYKNGAYRVLIDLKPGTDEKNLDKLILADFSAHRNRDVRNALDNLAGRLMIPVLLRLSGIPGDTKVNSVTREQRQKLVRLLKAFPITVAGPRPVEEAVVTRGGVDVRQVDPKTMESKLVKGLYFAGEILDVDACTGGFNLQIAWLHRLCGRKLCFAIRQEEFMNSKTYSIAIDGPSGAGKSTLSRLAAKIFGFIYVDTGALYRTVGLAAYMAGIDSKDDAGVTALLPTLDIQLRYDDSGGQRMYLNGMDVTDKIRTPIISIYASDVSAMAPVRAFLLDTQRNMAKTMNVIMDGRDIGTVVLPDADLKIFLTATPEDRAMRRYLELRERGDTSTYEEVLRDIQYRDKNDSCRENAPLKPAPDAIILDTTGNTLQESLDLICSVIREKLNL